MNRVEGACAALAHVGQEGAPDLAGVDRLVARGDQLLVHRLELGGAVADAALELVVCGAQGDQSDLCSLMSLTIASR